MVATLEKRYKEYQEKATQVRKKSSFVDNFLGTGNAANKHPCHEEFYEDVLKLVADYAATEPASQEAAAVAEFLLTEPQKYKERDCYAFMYVMVGCVRDMIPFMTGEDCGKVLQCMDSLYKKRERMPIHEDTYKKLKKAAK